MIKVSKPYGIKLSMLCGQKRVSVHTKMVGLRLLIDYFLYPTNNYNRTQRRSPLVPSEWVGGLPNGQGTMLPSSWVQDDPTAGYKIHERRHQNDVIMNIMFNLNSDSQC